MFVSYFTRVCTLKGVATKHVYVYSHIQVGIIGHGSADLYLCTYIDLYDMCDCTYGCCTCTYACIYTHTYTHTYMYIYTYIYIYVHIYIYIYTYIYICIYKYTFGSGSKNFTLHFLRETNLLPRFDVCHHVFRYLCCCNMKDALHLHTYMDSTYQYTCLGNATDEQYMYTYMDSTYQYFNSTWQSRSWQHFFWHLRRCNVQDQPHMHTCIDLTYQYLKSTRQSTSSQHFFGCLCCWDMKDELHMLK